LKKLKERGFLVKLDTNGLDSRTLEECLPYLDYVALDVKTSPSKYPTLGAGNTSELIHTIEILKANKVDYEFRTTVVPGYSKMAGPSIRLPAQMSVPRNTFVRTNFPSSPK
jgi:pyruvate formate lyase activating enzyme